MKPIEGTVEGIVIECLPSSLYKTELTDGKTIICYLAGKLRVNKIRVMVGDKLQILLDPWKGKTTNRIIYRL